MTEKSTLDQAAEIRRRAEGKAKGNQAEIQDALSPEEARQVLHELRVHQIELEMQNEELRRAQAELEASRARYFDLYDLAPVGYFTVSEQGVILEANLTAAGLLGVARGALVKQPLTRFIVHEDQDTYYLHRKQLLETGAPQVCEFTMLRADAAPFWARLEAAAAQGADGAPVFRAVISDISERKRGEEALRETKEYFENLIDCANAPIMVWDSQFRITRFNHAFESLCGRRAEEVLGKGLEILFPPDQVEDSMELIKKTVAGERWKAVDITILHVDGSVRSVLWNSAMIPEADGKTPMATMAQGQDITERKRAEETLIASEIRYRRLFESALDGILILDADTGVIIDANFFLIELLGFPREQILGKKVWDLGFVKDVIASQDSFLELQQKKYVRYENLPLETADGRQIAVEFISTVYLVGQTKLVQCSIRDLTERRRAEEVLALNNARLEVLLELHEKMNAPRQEILDFCLEGALKTVQSGFSFVGMMDEEESTLTVHAWSKETMRECAIDNKPLCFPITGAGLWADCVRQRKAAIINDYDAPLPGKKGCPDGHVKLKRLLCVPVFDGTRIIAVAAAANKKDPYDQEDVAALTALMSKMWEILRYKRAEEQVRHTLEGLESSNKELEQFAYVASHDLQEPLRMVSSYMQLLAERYEPQLDDKARKFIHYAVDGAVRMQRLINDLLAYSRVATRGTVFAPVDSHAALGGAIANLQLAIDEAGPVITNDDLPEVRADSSQLTQVFQNLIGNAIKFHGPETPHIHVSAKTRGETAEFSVRDNGIGIDQKYKDQVFVIFQRLHTMSEYPGTGIGLALCKRIIEHHGGKIWFESEPGKGAVFYFTLPTTKKEIK